MAIIMNNSSAKNKSNLLVICGATAVGKTALSIKVAQAFSAEIVSADSRQFYTEMNIGTAKPSAQELAAVPHHFVNNISIHRKSYSAGKYEVEVLDFLEQYFKANSIAVMVGGAGLFINAVCSGFDSFSNAAGNKEESDANVYTARKFLNTQTLEWLQNEVERLDPEYYEKVDRKNPVRLKRALEIIYSTGKKYSEQRIGKKTERPFNIIKVGLELPREALFARINNRVDAMMENGLMEEVKDLYLHKKKPALNTVGYEELFDVIEDKISLPGAIELIKKNTRNYAKRQMTWFKKDDNVQWFAPDAFEDIVEYFKQHIV